MEMGVGRRVCTRWVGLHVIAEKLKIYSYIHVVKNPYPQIDSYRPDKFKCLYSRISLIWHPQNWRGTGFLNIPFIKQHLY